MGGLTRIIIADDHALVRRGLRTLLESHTDWQVCAEASNGNEAIEKAVELNADVAILDIGMPELNGLEATRRICSASPRTEVLILTMHQSEELVHEVLQAGARGYVLKSDADLSLIAAVEALIQHQPFLTPAVSEIVLEDFLTVRPGTAGPQSRTRITSREREIIQLLAEGKCNKEVAVALNISVRTAEVHRANIMRKLAFGSLSDLVRYAIRNNIVAA